jgi:decaprenylphospho-beta-D-erythro-pentofuranosid-2-ulose 2-reductase
MAKVEMRMKNSVLILGATSDIAIALAHEYARNGYPLILAARKTIHLRPIQKDLELRYQVPVETAVFDVLDLPSHRNFLAGLSTPLCGSILAVGLLGSQKRASDDFIHRCEILETNFLGSVSILTEVATVLKKEKQGFIIGISSVAGDRGRQSNYFYGSAKAGLSAFLSGLRNELFSQNIQVLTVKPGFVDTKMTEGIDLPKLVTVTPGRVASDIYKAQVKGRHVLYTPWFWWAIMACVKVIPEWFFKRLKL